MNNIIIKKISSNMINFVDINGILNINNRTLEFNVKNKEYTTIFPNGINSSIDLFLEDINGKKYSCIECIISYKINKEVEIKVINMNLIFENLITKKDNIKTKNIIFETTYPKHWLYACYINNFEFNYSTTKKISIKKEINSEYTKLIFTITNKNEIRREKLDDVLYSILEIIYLIFGSIPYLKQYKFKYKDIEVTLHFQLADKYIQNTKSGSNDDALSIIDKNVLTKELIKKFIKFRKETSILYDMFLINQSGINYIEITNSMLIQLMEGTFLTLNPTIKKELWEILEYYFITNPNTNMLLNKKDLKNAKDYHNTPIFLYKAKEHRNYISHLNMNEKKKVFNGLENNYAKFKLVLCLRLIYMEYLGIKYDPKMLNNIIQSIDNWGKKHKIKI